MEWQSEFVLIAVITFLAVISPGPDFAVTTRNSLIYGRRAGLETAAGIASGVSVHIVYTLLGLGYIMAASVTLLEVMRYLGAAYLIWLGVSAFLSSKSPTEAAGTTGTPPISAGQAFRDGFICNALNPKTALFFIALFTQVVDPETSQVLQAGLGAFIALAHLLWFGLVAILLTHARCQSIFARAGNWIERTVGVCLLGLGAKLALDT